MRLCIVVLTMQSYKADMQRTIKYRRNIDKIILNIYLKNK